jgi:hypothetical protein
LIRVRHLRSHDVDREVPKRFWAAAALAEWIARAQWNAVERVAQALLQCGAINGALVRTLIDTAPTKAKSLPTLEADLALMERAERAEPTMRGATAELRRRLDEERLEHMRMILHALETYEPASAKSPVRALAR